MIPSIANPTELVGAMPLHLACARPLCRLKAPLGLSLLRKRGLSEKYRTARIYSPWRFLPPRNTPDLFCRRFTRQNFSLDLQGGSFLLWDRNCKPFTKPWQGGDPKRDLSRQFVSQRQIPRGCPSCPWPRLANLWKIFLLRCQDDGKPAVQMRTSDASWNQMSVRLTTLLQSRRPFSHHSEVCPPSQNHSSWQLARCSAGERKRHWDVYRISRRHRQHWARTAFYFMVALLRCCWMVCTPQWTFLPLLLPCISRNNSRRQGDCISSRAQWVWNYPASECQRRAGNHAAERIQSSVQCLQIIKKMGSQWRGKQPLFQWMVSIAELLNFMLLQIISPTITALLQ